ncbi:MAG: energy transducer TonB [Bacteroidetes bacterium]|nr:energy transducer TonB [Bacteroidota bacterium]
MKTYLTYLELIFENRNQSYGAYVLRRDYPLNIKKAFAYVTFTLLLLLLFPFIIKEDKPIPYRMTNITKPLHPNIKLVDDIIQTIVNPPKAMNKTSDQSYHLVNKPAAQLVPENLPTAIPSIANPTIAPDNGAGIPGQSTSAGSSGIPVLSIPTESKVNTEAIYNPDQVHELAEFIGGEDKLYDFLRDNLRYPNWEQEQGISGKVIIAFIVDKEGKVSDVEIYQSSNRKNFDKEALRVCSMIPNWKPAKVEGHAVKSRMHLPIAFD